MTLTLSRFISVPWLGKTSLRAAVLLVRSLLPSVVCDADRLIINDSNFHRTNQVQEGTDIRNFLKIMGNKVGRVALFGIPLQQQWSYRIAGKRGPAYYLQSDILLAAS